MLVVKMRTWKTAKKPFSLADRRERAAQPKDDMRDTLAPTLSPRPAPRTAMIRQRGLGFTREKASAQLMGPDRGGLMPGTQPTQV